MIDIIFVYKKLKIQQINKIHDIFHFTSRENFNVILKTGILKSSITPIIKFQTVLSELDIDRETGFMFFFKNINKIFGIRRTSNYRIKIPTCHIRSLLVQNSYYCKLDSALMIEASELNLYEYKVYYCQVVKGRLQDWNRF